MLFTEVALKTLLVKNLAENNANYVTFGIANGIVKKSYHKADPALIIAAKEEEIKNLKQVIANYENNEQC